jgi:nucleoside-diphosphate-sugar epimerase
MQPAILFVGAGYTGARVLSRLPETTALGRSQPGDRRLDLDGDAKLSIALPAAYDVIYSVPPSRGALTDVRLERLLGLLSPAPRRFVYLSTTGVYGNRDGATVDESTQPRPESDRAARRVAAEQQVRNWCAEHDSIAIILRIPGIYGPGRLGLDRIREGMPIIAEEDANPGNRIHVDDLAACCIAALSEDVPGGIYNVGDGDHRSSTWFTNEVARQASLPPPPTVSREEAEKTFSPMRLSFLRESRIVDTQKMRDVLGITPTNPVDGIARSLAEESAS